jgi:ATP-dependent RNA helicase DHR2
MPETIHTRFDNNLDERVHPPSVESKKRKRNGIPVDNTVDIREPKKSFPPHLRSQNSQPSSKPRSGSLREKKETLLAVRKQLPIWPHANEIRESLRSKDLLLLVGETGSGKSTQVPQFLLDELWCKQSGCIAITQPRRVAAISLARRVAEEMGTPLGSASPASKVGYSVRFDNSTSPSTKIKFLTEGMLLQEMLRDPWLVQYSVVVVDEVHERSVNVDLILGFLRNIITGDLAGRKGRQLKVVVMSATADIESLQRFFEAGFIVDQLPDGENDNDSQSSWSGILSEPEEVTDNRHAISTPNASGKNEPKSQNVVHPTTHHISICHIEGRQYPVKINYIPEPTQDFVEAALQAIFQIHYKEPLPGDILIFLTGQDTVETLERLVTEYASSMGPEVPKVSSFLDADISLYFLQANTPNRQLLPLPLFAALAPAIQHRVFQPAPTKNTRKVIIATNIAETSITVPGIRHVIDSGKHKLKQYRTLLGLESLLTKPISRSSAIQRAGRAGREAPGTCWRLYTEEAFRALDRVTRPEILRCDLADAVLVMKARGVEDVMGFPLMDRPSREAMERALLLLFRLGALDEKGGISEMGKKMAGMPLSPGLGRVMLEAARAGGNVVLEVVDVIAALSVESVFLTIATEEGKEVVEEKRRELFSREGDHLTLLKAVKGYAAEQTDRKAWAEKYGVSHRAMQNVMNVRKQLRAQCKAMGLVDDNVESSSMNLEAKNEAILRCVLKGFATNTARLVPDGSYRTFIGNQTVSIHPSSVLFGKKVEAIVFNEYVYTNKSYARNVSAVRLGWVEEALVGSETETS